MNIVEFNGNKFGACKIQGESPVWEMHPDTDDFFHILEGEFIVVLRESDGFREYRATAGDVFVIPRGHLAQTWCA